MIAAITSWEPKFVGKKKETKLGGGKKKGRSGQETRYFIPDYRKGISLFTSKVIKRVTMQCLHSEARSRMILQYYSMMIRQILASLLGAIPLLLHKPPQTGLWSLSRHNGTVLSWTVSWWQMAFKSGIMKVLAGHPVWLLHSHVCISIRSSSGSFRTHWLLLSEHSEDRKQGRSLQACVWDLA